jgi:hypothetical protein
VTAQQIEKLQRQGFTCQANIDNAQAKIVPGKKYTRIDVGGSGKLMIDDNGDIYGIKGYGTINKGHRYGSLDTIGAWYWGEYYPRPCQPYNVFQYIGNAPEIHPTKLERRAPVKYQYADDVKQLHHLDDMPAGIADISRAWTEKAAAVGDHGSCVCGAGFLFKLQKKWYFLPPLDSPQGSISWEHDHEEIQKRLEAAGATDIHYEWGNMD